MIQPAKPAKSPKAAQSKKAQKAGTKKKKVVKKVGYKTTKEQPLCWVNFSFFDFDFAATPQLFRLPSRQSAPFAARLLLFHGGVCRCIDFPVEKLKPTNCLSLAGVADPVAILLLLLSMQNSNRSASTRWGCSLISPSHTTPSVVLLLLYFVLFFHLSRAWNFGPWARSGCIPKTADQTVGQSGQSRSQGRSRGSRRRPREEEEEGQEGPQQAQGRYVGLHAVLSKGTTHGELEAQQGRATNRLSRKKAPCFFLPFLYIE